MRIQFGMLCMVLLLSLTACGGDGGGTTPTLTNSIPEVAAPNTQIISVMLGGVTSGEAKVFTSATESNNLIIDFGNQNVGYLQQESTEVFEINGSSLYQFQLTGLLPETCYEYSFLEAKSRIDSFPTKSFCTFSQNPQFLKIGLLADLDYRMKIPAPSISSLAERDPDIVLLVGDWDHRNPQTFGGFVDMHMENQMDEKLSALDFNQFFSSRIPVSYVWDDHDFGDNNSNRHSPTKPDAIRAYDIFWPSYGRPNPTEGIWQNFTFGNLAEVFVLDLRSHRDFDTYQDPRFIGDYLQESNRDALRWDPERSILDGEELPEENPGGQKEWLKAALLNSSAQWKIIVSTVTWNVTTVKDDAWWDFMYEREEIFNFINDNNISGAFFVSGDIHSGGAIDNGDNAGLPEISLPSTNLNPDSPGRATCNVHPEPTRASPSSCGDWSEGFLEHGSGYGLISLSFNEATLETENQLGGSVKLIISSP